MSFNETLLCALIMALVVALMHMLYRFEIARAQYRAFKEIVKEAMDTLKMAHEVNLTAERNKATAHCLKMRMQHRDFSSKVGGLQRKLRESNWHMKTLKDKVYSMEGAEEDATELENALIDARELMRKKDQTIETLKKQLNDSQSMRADMQSKYLIKIRYLEKQLELSELEDKENNVY
ncbi:unnamed protein product [Caenorhabditis sp. 36 PRJEB53466]|nr:unnamed protein product [Caenorhabditis sp. 36 PRJEB53466]